MTERLTDIIRAIIDSESHAEPAGHARFAWHGSALIIYGTNDENDVVDDLDGRSNRSLPGLNIADGAVDHAQTIEAAMLPGAIEAATRIYGHSLGGCAAWVLAATYGKRCVTFGAYRSINGSVYDEALPDTYQRGMIKDVTMWSDPITWWPPWNDRVPWWLGERIRLQPPAGLWRRPWTVHRLTTYLKAARDISVAWGA